MASLPPRLATLAAFAALALAILVPFAVRADWRTPLPGPIPASVARVLDGDTLEARARVWIGQEVRVLVRLRGIDAAELNAPCAEARALAEAARDWLAAAVASGEVLLRRVGNGKYAGRVVAEVWTPDGRDLAEELLRAGLARPYDGRKRAPWCPIAVGGG